MEFINQFTKTMEFQDVLTIQGSLEDMQHHSPSLSEGWWEFSKLTQSVRKEFAREYWVHALPYMPHIYRQIDQFFSKVNQIEIFLVRRQKKEMYNPFMVYALENCFYCGAPPLCQKERDHFKQLIAFPLPQDYLDFFLIHNGFSRGNEAGVFPLVSLSEQYQQFQLQAEALPKKLTLDEKSVDATQLLPFYRSFGFELYQCFYKDWYPDGEVGNVFCSLKEGALSSWRQGETYAFVSFSDWLGFYLE